MVKNRLRRLGILQLLLPRNRVSNRLEALQQALSVIKGYPFDLEKNGSLATESPSDLNGSPEHLKVTFEESESEIR